MKVNIIIIPKYKKFYGMIAYHGVHVSKTRQEIRELLLDGRVHRRCHREPSQRVEAMDMPGPPTKVVELAP